MGEDQFILAWLTFKYIEKPIRHGTRSVSKIICLCLVMLLTGILGFSIFHNRGFENRIESASKGDVTHFEFMQYMDERYIDCEAEGVAKNSQTYKGFLRCKQSKRGEPDIVILGDSHAEHLFIGFANALPSENIAYYIQGGAPFLDNPAFTEIYKHLLNLSTPKTIYFAMYYDAHIDDEGTLTKGLSSVITALKGAGHAITLLGDVPRFHIHPKDCITSEHLFFRKSKKCEMPVSQNNRQEERYHSDLINLSNTHDVKYFRISETLCGAAKCSMASGDTIL